MSLSPERLTTTPPPERFTIPETENPIEYGANALREYLGKLASERLRGAFPVNGGYLTPNYNLVYETLSYEEGKYQGFSKADHVITLEADGKIRTGRVERVVRSSSNYLDFQLAALRPATDMEILEHSQELLDALVWQVQEELEDHTSESSAHTALSFLEERVQMRAKVREIIKETSYQADLDLVAIEELHDDEFLAEEEAEIKQAREALNLYLERQRIVDSIRDTAAKGRLPLLRADIAKLLERAKSDQLFPAVNFLGIRRNVYEGIVLKSFRKNRPLIESRDDLETIHGVKNGPFYFLVATPENQVLEVDAYTPENPPRECAEHLIEYSGLIAGSIIGMSTETVFPKLEYDVL